jgi:type I restriction enzyme S subunit
MKLLGTVPAKTMKSSANQFTPGDVLYGRLRPYLNKVHRTVFAGLCSAEFIVFPDTAHLSSQFLQYRLNAADFVTFASHLDEGDRPRVDFDQIGAFVLKLPPVEEQHRIVAKVEELLSDLDAGVSALRRAQASLKKYRAAVLKSAVTGELTAEWRAAHPNVEPATKLLDRILAERRRKWEADQQFKCAADGKTLLKNWQQKYKPPATPDTTNLTDHPLAAGPAQRVVLDVLGRRTRREFRSTWHFLDWAQSNGVEFAPPLRDAVAER